MRTHPARRVAEAGGPRKVVTDVHSAHVRWIVGAWAVVAVVGWASDALIGWEQGGFVPLVLAVLVWRRLWSPSEKRRVREATGAALRRHDDPGAELRAATAAHARESATRAPRFSWGLALVLLVLAVGCAVVGWQREDGWDAAPAGALLAVAGGTLVVDHVSRRRARRWIDDPPYAVVDTAS